MYTINIIRCGRVYLTYQVNNIRVCLSQLAYLSVSSEGNTYNVVMAVTDTQPIVNLSTGNVGQITKGLG